MKLNGLTLLLYAQTMVCEAQLKWMVKACLCKRHAVPFLHIIDPLPTQRLGSRLASARGSRRFVYVWAAIIVAVSSLILQSAP